MDTSTYKPKNKSKALLYAEEEEWKRSKLSGKALADFDKQKAKAKEERKKRQEQEAHEFVQNYNKKNSDSAKPVFNIKDITFGKYFPENTNLTSKVNSETTKAVESINVIDNNNSAGTFAICALFGILLALCVLVHILIRTGKKNNISIFAEIVLIILYTVGISAFVLFLCNI